CARSPCYEDDSGDYYVPCAFDLW
nr:immunoglobulin heavy chain junction region [Macaca mulatta]